ncbi:hypothetical protein PHMEG_00022296 [Phytophthora megakarya]|uniref:Uncharacterized protein n=1 Tax=Phytophthora megakarya TaxID=4795 RepID=A0A225VKH2_9STRA|nr:hypothetical protein PHMEG_00022296 [Phytophthora megakarya]
MRRCIDQFTIEHVAAVPTAAVRTQRQPLPSALRYLTNEDFYFPALEDIVKAQRVLRALLQSINMEHSIGDGVVTIAHKVWQHANYRLGHKLLHTVARKDTGCPTKKAFIKFPYATHDTIFSTQIIRGKPDTCGMRTVPDGFLRKYLGTNDAYDGVFNSSLTSN